MIRPRWYKALNDLTGNKTRTLLIVLSMAVGLFAVGIILSASSILSVGLMRSFAAINPASGTLYTHEPFDNAFLKSVRAMNEVQEADARHTIRARIETSQGNWANITIFAIRDYNDIRVNKVSPQSGSWPPPKHEILIEPPAGNHWRQDRRQRANQAAQRHAQRYKDCRYGARPSPAAGRFDGNLYGYISSIHWNGWENLV
jgi:putative ABC transport system permease protein